jgi:hypothetical protein
MNEEIPNNIEPPLTVVYDRVEDPQEHADYYKSLMLGYKATTEAMMYHLFPGTLVKKANKMV